MDKQIAITCQYDYYSLIAEYESIILKQRFLVQDK